MQSIAMRARWNTKLLLPQRCMTVSFEILDNTASPCFEERLHGRALRRGKVMSREYSNDEKLLTKGEVARLCRVDVRTVDRWLTAGRLSCQRTPSGRALFRKQDVLTLFARTQTSAAAKRDR